MPCELIKDVAIKLKLYYENKSYSIMSDKVVLSINYLVFR
jgi:hypothetical protein